MGIKSFFNKIKTKLNFYNSSLVDGLQLYFRAHKFILTNKFKRYLLVSGLFFLLLFTVSIQWLLNFLSSIELPLIEWTLPKVKSFFNFEEGELRQGLKAVFWLLKKTIDTNKDAIFLFIFMIIGIPYFSFISSKTEQKLTGNTYPFKFKVFFRELKRGLNISLRTTFKQLLFILGITVVSFITYMDTITPLATFVVQAYYSGILITDYSLERRDYSIQETNKYYKQNKSSMFAIGLGFMFLLLIPVVGWFLAPTYALVASSFYFLRNSIDSSTKQLVT